MKRFPLDGSAMGCLGIGWGSFQSLAEVHALDNAPVSTGEAC
jgi:hypothetical protein